MRKALIALTIVAALTVGLMMPAQGHPYAIVVVGPAVGVIVEPQAHAGGGYCFGLVSTGSVTIARMTVPATTTTNTTTQCPTLAQFLSPIPPPVPPVSNLLAACPGQTAPPVTVCTVTPSVGTVAIVGSRDV